MFEGGEAGGEKQRKRAPAAPELQNRVSVGNGCPLGREPQHALFRRAEIRHIGRPPRRAVFQVRSEYQLEERRRDLVVLLIGRFGRDRDGRTAQRVENGGEPRRLGVDAAFFLFA